MELFRSLRTWKSKRPVCQICANKEGFTMNHVTRLRLIGRVTYYIGWIALVCGGLFHLNIATKQFVGCGSAAAESV